MPDTDVDTLHIPPHLITTVTHFHKRNSAEHMASGSYSWSQPPLCLVPKKQRNNDKYKKNVTIGDDHNVMRTYFRHRSKHFVCIISVKVSPPSHEAGIIITFADKETELRTT